jgi:hypothetical protein
MTLSRDMAISIANYDHVSMPFPLSDYPRPEGASTYEGPMSLWSALKYGIINFEQARDIAVSIHAAYLATAARWKEHYELRLTYERALLAAQGGTVADKNCPEVGGAVKSWVGGSRQWSLICKVNKTSVTLRDTWGYGDTFTRTVPFDKLKAIMSAAEVQAEKETGRLTMVAGSDGRVLGFYLTPSTEP